jgi:hypothetical protein
MTLALAAHAVDSVKERSPQQLAKHMVRLRKRRNAILARGETPPPELVQEIAEYERLHPNPAGGKGQGPPPASSAMPSPEPPPEPLPTVGVPHAPPPIDLTEPLPPSPGTTPPEREPPGAESRTGGEGSTPGPQAAPDTSYGPKKMTEAEREGVAEEGASLYCDWLADANKELAAAGRKHLSDKLIAGLVYPSAKRLILHFLPADFNMLEIDMAIIAGTGAVTWWRKRQLKKPEDIPRRTPPPAKPEPIDVTPIAPREDPPEDKPRRPIYDKHTADTETAEA